MAHVDVAIIGGGPAGSTLGGLLRKYGEDPRVLVLERETFPRDHVGESGLPSMCRVLDELGVWDDVEAAGFPIKVGATYKWGRNPELWDFDFVPMPVFDRQLPRPGRYEGQRAQLAFQVDRAIYDDILLRHAAKLGCEVRQNARVVKVHREGDRVTGLELDSGEVVTARHYVDASGHAGVLRRAMDVGVEVPTNLQNIAVWDYWRNAAWAEEIGVGGTRVQVISVHNGWVWFIPLGPDRTSVGLIMPAAYYKGQSKTTAELYTDALKEDARLARLLEGASSEGNLQTTKDWSFLSERHTGENWYLVGEASGFADPILAAGMTIAHFSAREVAFTILEINRGGDEEWLKSAYDERQSTRVGNHIRFADYWYSANAQFTDLQAFTAEVARANGLDLSPERAWAWLAQGGFIDDDSHTGTAGFPLPVLKQLGAFLGELRPTAKLHKSNLFELDLEGATLTAKPKYRRGGVERSEAWVREGRTLPVEHPFDFWLWALKNPLDAAGVKDRLDYHLAAEDRMGPHGDLMPALEAMIEDGWVKASLDKSRSRLALQTYIPALHPH